MEDHKIHSFHIPVMGLAFTIDTPLKIAKYGISSVVSVGDDVLLEDMRAHYSKKYGVDYSPIKKDDEDYRARRITAYFNLLNNIVKEQFAALKLSPFAEGSEIIKYLELLETSSFLGKLYTQWKNVTDPSEKLLIEAEIRQNLKPGSIDINIMTKLDKTNTAKDGTALPAIYSDALAALRGFAKSDLHSSVVFSAGFNPRLYGYIEEFDDFFPDEKGFFKKKVIIKVSDFRSAQIQGKYLAKKGIFVSEFRIESGLNCGGHAFATEGHLLGPILEEFKANRQALRNELLQLCRPVWEKRNIDNIAAIQPPIRVTAQGGIGTANEHKFLLEHFALDATGWGTPFLLVPEATTVDEKTLEKLINAKAADLYLSDASPLGVPFNNLRQSFSELELKKRLAQDRPGSPCLKKFLVSNTEFTKEPICTASRQYQHLKIKQLEEQQLDENEYKKAFNNIIVKACLCEDLSASAYINTNEKPKIKPAPAICPGPNLAFFSSKFSLKEMVDHIYGRSNVLNNTYRPNMFINELKMYIDYLKKEIDKTIKPIPAKKMQYFNSFKSNLAEGINYYKALIPKLVHESMAYMAMMQYDLEKLEEKLVAVVIADEEEINELVLQA